MLMIKSDNWGRNGSSSRDRHLASCTSLYPECHCHSKTECKMSVWITDYFIYIFYWTLDNSVGQCAKQPFQLSGPNSDECFLSFIYSFLSYEAILAPCFALAENGIMASIIIQLVLIIYLIYWVIFQAIFFTFTNMQDLPSWKFRNSFIVTGWVPASTLGLTIKKYLYAIMVNVDAVDIVRSCKSWMNEPNFQNQTGTPPTYGNITSWKFSTKIKALNSPLPSLVTVKHELKHCHPHTQKKNHKRIFLGYSGWEVKRT